VVRREPARDALSLHAVSLLTVATLFTLFFLRSLDDNRLTSWRWAFAAEDALSWVLLLVIAVLVAHAAGLVGSRMRRPQLVLFGSGFAVAALLWSEPEVIVDAARYFTQAKQAEVHGIAYFLQAWGGEIPAWTDLPLVPLLYGAIFSLFGEERVYIQVCTSLLFAGTLVLTYRLGRALWGDAVGLTAGALLLGMPYLLVQVPLMLVDVPTMFFVTLAIWATLAGVRRGGTANLALAAVAVALAMCTKYSAWLMLSALPLVALAEWRAGAEAALRRAGAIAALAVLLACIALLPMAGVIGAQLALLRDFQAPGLGRWEESFVSTFLFQIHPFITLAAAASLVLAWRVRDGRYAIVVWVPLLLLALGIRRARYLVPMLPMFALMAAYGLQAIRGIELRRHAVLCVVATSLAIALFGFLPFLQRASAANLARAGAYLDTLGDESIEVVTLPQVDLPVNPAISVPLLDLHTGKRLVSRAPSGAPPPAQYALSPLRFTWEYRSPSYYRARPQDTRTLPVAVIASEDRASLPPWLAQRLASHRAAREFAGSENVFGYRTLVSVYLPTSSGAFLSLEHSHGKR
jgi:hypothetical protein